MQGINQIKIAVLGGGNIGTQFACVAAAKGCSVNVYSSKPECYDGELTIVGENDAVDCCGRINMVSDDIGAVVTDCDVVFATHPAFQLVSLAKQMLPFVKEGMHIGVLPGLGGAEFAFRECVEKGAVLFGLQRVPAVARLVTYGKCVRVTGKRDCLHLASVPGDKAPELAAFISELLDMPCQVLPNYLCVTLTPSNPILHTTRLCSMFRDYAPGVVYDRNPMFYEDWTDDASRLLFACDEELQALCRSLSKLDLSTVRSLRLHYESDTPEKLTQKIHSIRSFRGLESPMRPVDGGWVPDFDSRYFSADFPFGLAIIEQIADIACVDIPHIRYTMDWYRRVTGNTDQFDLSSFGIRTVADIYSLYGSSDMMPSL